MVFCDNCELKQSCEAPWKWGAAMMCCKLLSDHCEKEYEHLKYKGKEV